MSEEQEVAPIEEATEEVVESKEQDTAEEEQQETAGEAEESQEEDKPKSRHQRRAAAMERLRHEADEASKKAKNLEERQRQIDAYAQSAKPPVESDFKTYEEFQAAMSGYYAMRQFDERSRAELEREQADHRKEVERIDKAREAEVAQEWAAQTSDAKSRYADFEKVAYSAPISDSVGKMIVGMESGADVAYHLGMNPQVAQEISRMSPVDAAMALGRLEARLSAPKPRTETQAPDPVAPVRPKATPSKDPSKMSYAEYKAARTAGKL